MSKMLISVIPRMIYKSNDTILNFFDNAIYNPPVLDTVLIVPWPPETDEFIFTSQSSIISPYRLVKQLVQEGKLDKN
jgi:hypothetical protein